MKKNFFKEILSNLIITVTTSFMLFLINRYFSNYIGVEKLGLMKLFNQLLAYLNLAEIGMVSASTYALYKPLLERDETKLSVLISTISSIYKKIFLVIITVGILVTPAIPFFIANSVVKKEIYLYWILYVIGSSLNYLFAKYAILLTADQKFITLRYIQGGSKFLFQCLQLWVIIEFRSFVLFILLLIGDAFFQAFFLHYFYKKYYFFIKKTKERDYSIVKDLKNLFWHKFGGLVVFNTDLILISKYTSLEIVGIYASYLMINQMVLTIFKIVYNVLRPKIGKYIVEHTKEEVYNYWRALNIVFLFFSVIFIVCTYKLLDSFLILWMGKEFVLPPTTKMLILFNLGIQCFREVTEMFKDGYGFFDDIELPILEAGINFFLSLILVIHIGLNGVIIGTIISNILVICIAKPIFVFKRCFKKSVYEYSKVYFIYLVLISISLFFNALFFKIFLWKAKISWKSWILEGIIVFIVVSIITGLVFGVLSKDFRENIKKIVYTKRKKTEN